MEALFVILGWLSFHCLVMIEINSNGGSNNPITYLKSRPIKVTLSVLGAILGYFVTQATIPTETSESLVILAYAASGYAPYHIFEILSKFKQTPDVTSEKIEEFKPLPKFQAHDITTWIKRK